MNKLNIENKPIARILLVFIHGFRGSNMTFEGFPEQLKSSLGKLIPEAHTNIAVYPQFETQGSLKLAVDSFCDWIKAIEQHRLSQPGNEMPMLTILIGHSMGGLLATDAYLRFLNQKKHKNSGSLNKEELLFPEILGVIAFETPFYGLNKKMLSRHASSKASAVSSMADTAMSAFSKRFSSTVSERAANPEKSNSGSLSNGAKFAIGGLAIAAVAAGAYLYKDKFETFYSYIAGHLEFINELNKPRDLATRVEAMLKNKDTLFHCFYVETPIENDTSTFIALPGEGGAPNTGSSIFTPINYTSNDEIQGHVRMFNPKINTSYYEMAQQTVGLIHYAVRNYQARIQNSSIPISKPQINPMGFNYKANLDLD